MVCRRSHLSLWAKLLLHLHCFYISIGTTKRAKQ